jgi:hypothetical protein
MSIKSRLARLEAKRPPEPFKPALTFMWFSEKDDAALAEMDAQAEAEGRMLWVIRIVEPPPRELRHAEY